MLDGAIRLEVRMINHSINADYIRGFSDGEGGFHRNRVHIANTDFRIIERIRDCLSELDIECTVQKHEFADLKRADCFVIIIMGVLNLMRFAVLIGFCQNRKQLALEQYIRHVCRKGRKYNLPDYYEYCKLNNQGTSILQMSKTLNIAYYSMWRRIRQGTYPIPDDDLAILKLFDASCNEAQLS